MSAYTPTISEVREAVNEWVWSRRMWRPELTSPDGMEFDRWLAAVERAAAEKAWDEGKAAAGIMLPSNPPRFLTNPYRKDQR